MRSDTSKAELVAEFRELADPNIELAKEVFAHFGLVFMKFGLVEHAMINVLTFGRVIDAIKSGTAKDETSYQAAFDKSFENAKALTFGNLVRGILRIKEFRDLEESLKTTKKKRDYFAHHFMREESAYFGDAEGCWFLLIKIADVRRELMSLESEIEIRRNEMCARAKFPLPDEAALQGMVAGYHQDALNKLASGDATVGWEH